LADIFIPRAIRIAASRLGFNLLFFRSGIAPSRVCFNDLLCLSLIGIAKVERFLLSANYF
jgi:hypothetical protein